MTTEQLHSALLLRVTAPAAEAPPQTPELGSGAQAAPETAKKTLSATTQGYDQEEARAVRVSGPRAKTDASPLIDFIKKHEQPDLTKPNFATYRNFVGVETVGGMKAGVPCKAILTTMVLPASVTPDKARTIEPSKHGLGIDVITNMDPEALAPGVTRWFRQHGAYCLT